MFSCQVFNNKSDFWMINWQVKSCTFRGFDCMGMDEDSFDHEVSFWPPSLYHQLNAEYTFYQVVLNPVYGNCYNFYLVDPSIGDAVFVLFFSSNFALRYQLVPFQCISTRAVIYVWGELWTQPGIEHRAQWLPERRPGDPQNEMYLVWAEIIHQIRF